VRNIFGGPTAVLLIDLPFVILFIGLIALIAAPFLIVPAGVTGAFLINAWWSSRAVRKATANKQGASYGRGSAGGRAGSRSGDRQGAGAVGNGAPAMGRASRERDCTLAGTRQPE